MCKKDNTEKDRALKSMNYVEESAPLYREHGREGKREKKTKKGKTKGVYKTGSKVNEKRKGVSPSTLDYLQVNVEQAAEAINLVEKSDFNHIHTIIRKGACNCSWCLICGAKRLRKVLMEIFKEWDYRYVRSYVLSADRELFDSPYDAYMRIQRERGLGEYVRRLRKRLVVHGIKILDYIWILEWYKDGFPHWHCYVLINKKGKAGRLTKKVSLTETWGYARYVHEEYIKDYNHWKRTMGYVAKQGYFADGKKEQVILPAWARDLYKDGSERIRIKRSERMRKPAKKRSNKRSKGATLAQIASLITTFDCDGYYELTGEYYSINSEREPRKWGEALDNCGAYSCVNILHSDFYGGYKVKIPYNDLKVYGEYKDGVGYTGYLTKDQVLEILKMTIEEFDFRYMEESEYQEYKRIQVEMNINKISQDQLRLPF
ncbi:hypothetical protein ACFLZG_01895 [Thermodesulfobacteriota bacterium]